MTAEIICVGTELLLEKDIEFGRYYLYVNGTQYAEAKTLKTAKKYAEEHYNK